MFVLKFLSPSVKINGCVADYYSDSHYLRKHFNENYLTIHFAFAFNVHFFNILYIMFFFFSCHLFQFNFHYTKNFRNYISFLLLKQKNKKNLQSLIFIIRKNRSRILKSINNCNKKRLKMKAGKWKKYSWRALFVAKCGNLKYEDLQGQN